MSRDAFIEKYRSLGALIIGDESTPQSIRVNPLHSNSEYLIDTLSEQDVVLEKVPYLSHGFQVKSSPFSLGASIEYLLGHYFLQETASQLPAQLLNPSSEDVVLDMAAAPGGKTSQMASIMGNRGSITAVDISRKRLYALENNLERMGVTNTAVYHMNSLDVQAEPIFTKILLDAPCSGNYVTDRNWFEKRTAEHISVNSQVQRDLLEKAINLLKSKGVLLYSTCSLEPEENELNVQWLIENHNVEVQEIDSPGSHGLTEVNGVQLDVSISKCRRLWPNEVGTQGFFIAKVEKL